MFAVAFGQLFSAFRAFMESGPALWILAHFLFMDSSLRELSARTPTFNRLPTAAITSAGFSGPAASAHGAPVCKAGATGHPQAFPFKAAFPLPASGRILTSP